MNKADINLEKTCSHEPHMIASYIIRLETGGGAADLTNASLAGMDRERLVAHTVRCLVVYTPAGDYML